MTAEKVMRLAESYINTHEDPLGSNNVIFNTDYYGVPVYGSSYPWCCAFVWDIFRMAGASQLFYNGQRTAYCPTVHSWGRNAGLIVDYYQAKYGDIVLFDWDGDGVADHIGFCENLNPDGSMATLEGNTSDASHSNGGWVLYRTRYKANIIAVIRPQYGDENVFKFTTNEIKVGDRGIDVWRLQMSMKARGYYNGDIDRYYSNDLAAGVKKWQDKAGIPQTGSFGNRYDWPTLYGLEKSGGYWLIHPTEIGTMDSKSVYLPQQILKASGYYTGSLDWDFGPLMRQGVQKFQKATGKLTVNGKLDIPTLRWLIGDK